MNRAVTDYEIKTATFQLGASKAPGPDGLPAGFFQKYWEIVGSSVTAFVHEVFQSGKVPERTNQSIICLLPKEESPDDISKFRPICLANVIIKIISKVIADRVKRVIGDLTGEWQTSFVPGRQATNNVIIAQEMLHMVRRRRKHKGDMVVKIDLEKAYDRVDWAYLEQILRMVGFGNMLIQVILSCLETSQLAVLWNGDRLPPFKPGRGLRQGDPLSPYLFVLCMEVLGQKIQQAVAAKQWRACRVRRDGPMISHLFFADDLLLFGEASCWQARRMHDILSDFCAQSGQRVNSRKSRIWYTPHTPARKIHAISMEFGIPQTHHLGKYLGVPLIHERVQSTHFDYLIDKVRLRLSGWKSSLLSRASRLVLIQAVTAAIPTYAMQSCRLPCKTLQMLERINRRFFWGDTEQKNTVHSVAWTTVCQPKPFGGLGLRALSSTNRIMLAKLAWRYLKEPTALWTTVITALHGPLGTLLCRSPPSTSSFITRGLIYGYALLRQGLRQTSDGLVETPPWWLPSSKGLFTTQSAYEFLLRESDPTSQPFAWSEVWKFKGPTRGSLVLWQMAHDRLKTKALLWGRNICENARCELCGVAYESSLHAVRDCHTARQVWQHLLPRTETEGLWAALDIRNWVLLNLQGGSQLFVPPRNWKYLFRMGVLEIWNWRNRKLYQEVEPPDPRTLARLILLHTVEL